MCLYAIQDFPACGLFPEDGVFFIPATLEEAIDDTVFVGCDDEFAIDKPIFLA